MVEMDKRKQELLASADALYQLGLQVEQARARLAALGKAGAGYDSAEVREAVARFQALDGAWKRKEQQHLALREEIRGEQ